MLRVEWISKQQSGLARLEPGCPGRRSGATLDFDVGRSSEGAESFPGEKECASEFRSFFLCSVHFVIFQTRHVAVCYLNFVFASEIRNGEATKF